jgi:CHAD domain-containing protein
MNSITPPRLCVRQVITGRLQKMLSHESGTRQDTDVEALHDMRVASRRLREAFEMFDFCFPAKSYQKLYRRIKQVTRALGEARNADVAMAYFNQLSASTDDILVHVALEDLLRRLARSRRRARQRLVRGLDQCNVQKLPGELAQVFSRIEAMPVRYQRGPRQSIGLARRLLAQRVREFLAASAAVTGETDEANLHKVRIAVKKLRYAVEALDYAVGERVTGNLKTLKQFQEALGEVHDRDVFAGIVRGRLEKLHAQPHSTLLRNGLQAVLNMIIKQRHEYFQEYESLAAQNKPQDWRARFVPPRAAAPARQSSITPAAGG